MKKSIAIFFFILSAWMSTSISMKASNSIETDGDSLSPIDYSGLANRFSYITDPILPVNEQEVKAGLLYDVASNKIVWQKNLNIAFPIASLTKMMVALLTIEDIELGKFKWDDNIQWTRAYSIGRGRHRRIVNQNEKYSLLDVFKATMIASNNECAEQMARYLGNGDLQFTIDRMNRRAKELGMSSTYYGNPTGLPSPNWMYDNAATPTDLLRLTVEMLKYQEILDIAKMGYATIENGKSTSVIHNHNRLTIDYAGEVDGLKTGYTRRAGFCLVATTAKCDRRLVSIVLGCRGPQIRNEVVRDMINNYYSSIGLDPLGPNCPSPLLPNPFLANKPETTSSNAQYVTITDKVKRVHVVRSGENLSLIAGKYNCSTAQLKLWNKAKIHGSKVITGQKLAVYSNVNKKILVSKPVNGSEEEDDKPLLTADEKVIKENSEVDNKTIPVETETAATLEFKKPISKQMVNNNHVAKLVHENQKYLYHTVAPGDTLFSIAQRYEGVTVAKLKSLNNIHNIHSLRPGTKLKVKVQV